MGLLRLLLIGAVVYLGYRVYLAMRALPARRSPPPAPPPPPSDPPERSPYEVLDVSPGASQEEIRAAYQKLVQQYHPDRVAGMGPELRELAEKHTKELNAAYAALKDRR
jgi:DnaJ-domain-containing protein 1